MGSEVLESGDYTVASKLTIPSAATVNRLNHSMLRIRNPEASLAFYRDVFGMSQTFSMNAGPFSIYYLAFPAPGDEVPSDILKTSGLRSGLLELVHVHETAERNGGVTSAEKSCSEMVRTGFGHLGFSVPDVNALLRKGESAGYEVLKWPGDISLGALELLDASCQHMLHDRFRGLYTQVGFLRDPDGYVEDS
jgi:lactoylglutathione lyase